MSHTPGPWKWVRDQRKTDDVHYATLDGPNGLRICMTGFADFDSDDSDAICFNNPDDARLIAAAPDLLDACKALLHGCPDDPRAATYQAHRKIAAAAIAKATSLEAQTASPAP